MFDKILIALGIAIVLFILWLFVSNSYPNLFGKKDTFSVPALASPVEEQIPYEPPRIVSPGGPSPPNATDASEEPPMLPPEVKGTDPFSEDNSSSHLTDNLRHPERMFSPGIKNTDTSIGPMAGIGSEGTQLTDQALQTFSPENTMNGGFFMNGISANDTTSSSDFAAF